MKKYNLTTLIIITALYAASCQHQPSEHQQKNNPLSSWNDTPIKKDIINFVDKATDANNANFIPVSERIAVFDNDGTLWCEQPLYFEMVYSFAAAKHILADNPELAKNPKLKDLTDKNLLKKHPAQAILEAFALSHSEMTAEQVSTMAKNWLDTATHSRFNTKYTALTYVPMVELIQYLQNNHFKVYIVTGGSSVFVREFSEQLYGIPKEQVIGTMLKAEYTPKDNTYKIIFTPELWHNNDKEGKPIAIEQIIGKKPVFAFGNSDGDLQMLQWTSTNTYSNMCLILHHTDAAREYAYDSLSTIGTLKYALIEGREKGWAIVDMKKDFKTVFSFEKK